MKPSASEGPTREVRADWLYMPRKAGFRLRPILSNWYIFVGTVALSPKTPHLRSFHTWCLQSLPNSWVTTRRIEKVPRLPYTYAHGLRLTSVYIGYTSRQPNERLPSGPSLSSLALATDACSLVIADFSIVMKYYWPCILLHHM